MSPLNKVTAIVQLLSKPELLVLNSVPHYAFFVDSVTSWLQIRQSLGDGTFFFYF